MAANLKIGIIADDQGAQQKFEQLSTSIDYTSKTVIQLANQFAKLNEANVKLSFDKTAEGAKQLEAVQSSMTTTANQLMNAIERQKLSWGTNRDSVSALKKELSELEKVETLLIQKGVGSSMSKELEDLTLITNKYAEYKKELQDAIKLKEELAKEQARSLSPSSVYSSAASSGSYITSGYLEGGAGKAKAEQDALAKALQQVTALLGAESQEAKALSAAMLDYSDRVIIATASERKQAEQIDANTAKYRKAMEEQQAKANSLAEFQNTLDKANIQNTLKKAEAMKNFTLALRDANLQQEQYNAQAKANVSGSLSSSFSQQTDYQAQELLGNKLNTLKADYEAYYQQLLKVISVYGAESEAAYNVAEKLKGLDSEIKRIGSSTSGTATRIKNLVKNFVSAQMIVGAIRKAFNTLTNTLKESATAASEAEETYNLFITTFEDAATTAESTASRLANAMGMAKSTAQKALGTFGDLAAGYGATDKAALEFGETATEVALDIISYKNITGDLDTTFQSIASGLAGNVENFRKLGYVMTQAEVKTKLQQKGLDKLTGSSLQYAQIQARLEILQEKSTKAQGDMIKTLDSTENVTRRLSEAWLEYEENLGKSINTVMTPVKSWLTQILTVANKVTNAMGEINGGEFTVKTEAVASGDELTKLLENLFAKTNGAKSGFWANVEEAVLGTTNTNVRTVSGKNAADIAMATGVDIEKVIEAIDRSSYFISDAEKESARETYNAILAQAQAQKDAEDAKNKKLEEIQSALTFTDSLSSINGVWLNSNSLATRYDAVKNDGDENEFVDTLEGDIQYAITAMISALASASSDKFVTDLDKALGNVDIEDQLEAKLSSATAVYEALWNEFYSSGEELTDWQKEALNSVLGIVSNVRQEIENLNAEAEKFSPTWQDSSYRTASDTSSSMSSYLSAFEAMAELTGADTWEISNTVEGYLQEISSALNGEMTKEDYDKFIDSLGDKMETVLSYSVGVNPSSLSSNPYDYLTPLDRATGKDTLLDALEAQLDAYEEYYTAALAYFKADGNITEEEQLALDQMLGSISDIQTKIDEQGVEPTAKQGLQGAVSTGFDSALESIQKGSSLLEGFTTGISSFSSALGGPLVMVMDLVSELDVVTQSLSIINDTILPVMNAFLEPLSNTLTIITEGIQNLLCDALEPYYKLFLSVMQPVNDLLTQAFEILGNFVNTVMQPVLSVIESVIPVIVYAVGLLQSVLGVCEPLLEVIGWIYNIITPLIESTLKPLLSVIKGIIEILVTGFMYVEVFFKKVIGSIGSAMFNVWNGIVKVLKSINILGWKPFENMNYADTTTMDTWKSLDYQKEVQKKLDELNKTTEQVHDAELTVAKNTEKTVDLSILNELLSKGIITGQEYEALANNKLGLPSASATETIKSEAGNYADYLRSGSKTSISYGDISIDINGTDKSPEEIAKAVARVLDEWQRNGRADWATA